VRVIARHRVTADGSRLPGQSSKTLIMKAPATVDRVFRAAFRPRSSALWSSKPASWSSGQGGRPGI